MGEQAKYADNRTFELPNGWAALDAPTRQRAYERTLEAFGLIEGEPRGSLPDAVLRRVVAYYDPEGAYAGSLFESVEPNDPWDVEAADLWAVSTLSMKVPPLTGRRLLAPGALRSNITRQLRLLEPTRSITDLTPDVLNTMWDLYDCFRTVMSTDETTSNWWVFGSKLSARKRPLLFPVRDSLVCRYLTDWNNLGDKEGQLGRFSRDIQVFAYLMTSDAVRQALETLRTGLADTHVAAHLDWSDLRLLDVALWTAAKDEARASGRASDDENDTDNDSSGE